MKLRSDFREALTNMHRLNRESGGKRPEPIHLYQYQRWHSSSSSSSTSMMSEHPKQVSLFFEAAHCMSSEVTDNL